MYGLFMLLLREDGEILGRKRSRFGKGPQGGNRTWVAVSTVALYVDALTTRLSAMTFNFI